MAFSYVCDQKLNSAIDPESGASLRMADGPPEDPGRGIRYAFQDRDIRVEFRTYFENRHAWVTRDGHDMWSFVDARACIIEPSLKSAFQRAYETSFHAAPDAGAYERFRETVRQAMAVLVTYGGEHLKWVPDFEVVFVETIPREQRRRVAGWKTNMTFVYDKYKAIDPESGASLRLSYGKGDDVAGLVRFIFQDANISVNFPTYFEHRRVPIKTRDGRDTWQLVDARAYIIEPSLKSNYQRAYEKAFQSAPDEAAYQRFREIVREATTVEVTRGGDALRWAPDFEVMFVDKLQLPKPPEPPEKLLFSHRGFAYAERQRRVVNPESGATLEEIPTRRNRRGVIRCLFRDRDIAVEFTANIDFRTTLVNRILERLNISEPFLRTAYQGAYEQAHGSSPDESAYQQFREVILDGMTPLADAIMARTLGGIKGPNFGIVFVEIPPPEIVPY